MCCLTWRTQIPCASLCRCALRGKGSRYQGFFGVFDCWFVSWNNIRWHLLFLLCYNGWIEFVRTVIWPKGICDRLLNAWYRHVLLVYVSYASDKAIHYNAAVQGHFFANRYIYPYAGSLTRIFLVDTECNRSRTPKFIQRTRGLPFSTIFVSD